MGLEILTLGSSKTYTRESLLGGGAVVGKNVTISSITPIEGGNKVTFSYTLDDGTVKTSSMNVMDGKDGKDGLNGKDGSDGADGLPGKDGKTPTITIGTNNNWFINGVDTGVKAIGEKGETGSGFNTTRQYSSVSDMMSDTNPANDSEIVVVVLGDVGNFYMRLSSYIDPDGITNGYLPIGSAQDISTIKGDPGKDGTDGITPHIDSATKHWFIGTNDTGVTAEGVDGTDGEDGVTPHIDSVTKHWFIGDTDTGIVAEGTSGNDGITPSIGTNGNWFIGDTDTGVLAHGVDGKDGKSIKSITKDENNNIITTFTDGTTQNIGQLAIDVEADFLTEAGFGKLRYYNGVLQYYNSETSSWVDTSVTPDNVYIMNIIPQPMQKITCTFDTDLYKYKLKWQEPADTIINDQVACLVDKVIIRRKLGSVPIDENDGNLVIEVKRKDFNSYKNTYFIDEELTPNDGDVYYYKAFPVSTTGFYNYSTVNETSGTKCKNYNLFGFKIDQNESNPASMITYIEDNKDFASAYMDYTADSFNYGDWKDAWFIRDLKPCMLKYDGTVDYELDKNDYTKKLDGTDSDVTNDSYEGNAMMGFPKVYWKIVDNGDETANVYISDKKVDDDFVCWSHIDNNGNEIDYCYMPIYNGSLIDGRLRSLSGKAPMNSQTGQNEINYAKANNLTDDIIWYTEVYCDIVLLQLLLTLIGKSTDSQTIFGNGHYTDGSNASHLLKTGTMNTKGLFWGTNGAWNGVKVFGIENFYGNQWHRVAGHMYVSGVQKIKMTYGQSDGSTTDGYNLNGTDYIEIPNSTCSGTSGGYISKMKFTKNGFIPLIASGSSTTKYCDGLWFAIGIMYLLFGGSCYYGARVGFFCSNFCNAASNSGWSVGASISCKPLATTN